MSETHLPWGIIGTNTYERLSSSAPGIKRRDVEDGVDYSPPPLSGGQYHYPWRKIDRAHEEDRAGADAVFYELKLEGQADPETVRMLADLGVRSLKEFQAELHSQPGDHLKELDRVANKLLTLLEHLHARGWGIGLLHPDNLLLLGQGEKLELVLPDLGFDWDSEKNPLPPHWVRDLSECNASWQKLWEGKTAQEQHRRRGDKPADLRLVARLFAWLMLGQGEPAAEMPDSQEDPSTYKPVWGVLDRVLAGHTTSAEAFRKALLTTPLSSHFRKQPSQWFQGALSLPWGRIWTAVLLLAVVALIGYGASEYLQTGLVPSPPPFEPDPCQPLSQPALPHSRVQRILDEEMPQKQSLPEKYDVLLKLYTAKLSLRPAEQQQEVLLRDHARCQLLNELRAWLQQVPARAEDEPANLDQLILDVQELRNYLEKLRSYQAHPSIRPEEDQCQEQCQLWLAQWHLAS